MISYKKWFILILSVVFLLIVLLIIFALKNKRHLQTTSISSEKKISVSHKPVDTNVGSYKKKKVFSSFPEQLKLLSAAWGRDPFSLDSLKTKSVETNMLVRQGLRTTDGRLLDLNLTGIVFFDNHYMALINNTGVREGDSILGFKVLKIKRDYIVLLDGSGDYYTLELK